MIIIDVLLLYMCISGKYMGVEITCDDVPMISVIFLIEFVKLIIIIFHMMTVMHVHH